MRSISIALLVLLLSEAGPAQAKLRVVATLSDLGSIAESVGGDRVQVDSIVDGRFDPHAVEILPSYMLKVNRADLFLQVGLDLEIWAPQIVQGARNRKLTVVDCTRGIPILEKPEGPVDASMGDIHVAGNPHVWLNPTNGLIIARNIADAFIQRDPDGAPHYEASLAAFSDNLRQRIEGWTQLAAPYHGLEIVYFHNSWPYFNDAFGFVSAAFVEPKPGVAPSPGHLAQLVELIRRRGIRVICLAPFLDRDACESIARQTDATLVVLASSVGAFEGVDSYADLFQVNLERLLAAAGDAP